MDWTDKEKARARMFTRRAALIVGGKLMLLSALAGRMYYLQVLESDRYRKLADDNRINIRPLAPPRGLIFDRHGAPLASNEQSFRLVLVAEDTGDVDLTLDALAELVPLSEHERRRVLRETRRKRSFMPVLVKDNLSWEEVSRIEVNALQLPGLSLEGGLARSYPYAEAAAHVIGYVAPPSERELTGDAVMELPDFRIGKTGIERFHDASLRGTAGASQVEINAFGRTVRELSRNEGKAGATVGLSIDIGLQNFTMARLASEESASAVVMSVADGEILALASHPSFDPAGFDRGLNGEEWQALLNHPRRPLSNKAIADQYPPGSTFKLVIALAALESGLVDASHRVFCPGHYNLGEGRSGVTFYCWTWKRGGHGTLDMVEAIAQSCDVYFYDVARRIGVERIAAMARRLGFGSDLDLDLPGARAGLVPTNEWKKATVGSSFTTGDTVNLGIGQGYVSVTPLQLATMVARIASGRAVMPRITHDISGGGQVSPRPQPPQLGIPQAHLAVVRSGMDGVSNGARGTAIGPTQRIANPAMRMAGKTGSAQVKRITQRDRDAKNTDPRKWEWRDRDHALFVAFAPVSDPIYCCAVVVEHGVAGGLTAAPIARDLLLEAQSRDILRHGPLERLA